MGPGLRQDDDGIDARPSPRLPQMLQRVLGAQRHP